MKGAFRCLIICDECALAADRLVMRSTQWGRDSETLPEPVRECVREYLRGLRARAAAAEAAKAARCGVRHG